MQTLLLLLYPALPTDGTIDSCQHSFSKWCTFEQKDKITQLKNPYDNINTETEEIENSKFSSKPQTMFSILTDTVEKLCANVTEIQEISAANTTTVV